MLFVQWASHCVSASIEHVGIDLGCFDIPVPQKLLDCPNIISILKQVRGKAVTKYMRADLFCDARNACGVPHSMIDRIEVNMMPSFDTGSWIYGQRV